MYTKMKSAATLLAVSLALLLAPNVAADELFAGSPCRMEDGGTGICKPLPDCPMRIKEVMEGKRFSTSSGRCTFENFVEIVCCPVTDTRIESSTRISTSTEPGDMGLNIDNQLGLRPADVACHEYENEIKGENGESINPNIFNGERAKEGEFPYMVALGYQTDKSNPSDIRYNCGGTLVSIRHVLTAAHCVNNINNFVPVEVRLGSVDLNDNSRYVQRIPVGDIISHPRYKRSLNYYDIAIIKLRRPINVSQNVMPICLQTKPIPNLAQLLNMSLIVTGWGATSFENEGSNSLQKTPSLQMIDRIECSVAYRGFSKLPNGLDESMICVLDKNVTRRSDACQGDSGGPLLLLSLVTSTVVGVTSFGQSCGSSIPAIYTSVYFYLDWIEDIVWPDKKRP